ncbi:MAG: biotin/lipoyl-binding protein [Desulfobulbaceae bacterium]|nr:biotin/lipoyl-binding protein [Desulfobulbaceae bacterium]
MRRFRVVVNGSEFEVAIEEIAGAGAAADVVAAVPAPREAGTSSAAPAARPVSRPAAVSPTGAIIAQMPGTIVGVEVSSGDRVTKGQTLLILEAMKMANEVVAPADGVVGEVKVVKGASVNAGDVLVVLT